MKKRLLIISLVFALLLALAPGAALAAKPVDFYAAGTISGISPGDVVAAGESGRWRVIERELTGELSGDVSGDFTMIYKANVELATQAGNFHGTMTVGSSEFKVNGQIQPLEMVPVSADVYLPKLTINGHWTAGEGVRGNGDFVGWLIFIPNSEGHVDTILASSLTMTGQW